MSSGRRASIHVVALSLLSLLPALVVHADSTSTTMPLPKPAPGADSTRHERVVTIQRQLERADSLLKLRGGVHAEDAQLFLSWNAPWGMRRASTALTPRCADTTATDTLFLSFLPGRTSTGFNGFSARLSFHAAPGDTLGDWWHMESRGGENGGNLQAEFGPSPTIPGRQPWAVTGYGYSQIKRTPTDMNLLVLYAVRHDAAVPIAADSVYTLARIIVRHRRADRLAGCGQSVCVEWTSATLAFELKDEPEVRRGERFVSYGRDAHACDASRGGALPVWKPRK